MILLKLLIVISFSFRFFIIWAYLVQFLKNIPIIEIL